MLINEAYFLNTCTHIPNLSGCVKEEGFQRFMIRNAEEALCLTLGICLVNDIKSYFETDTCIIDEENESLPEHFKWLIFGKEYEPKNSCSCNTSCNCVSVGKCNKLKWKGIIDPVNRESYLADYVYHNWLSRSDNHCCDDKDRHDEIKQEKRIDSWNNFVGWVTECNGCSVSLYQFLKDHAEYFETHEGVCLNLKNYWLI